MLVLSAATRRRFDTAGSTELHRRKRRPAWLRPEQTDLVPGKGQFRSRFHHPLSYCRPTTIFLDPRNRHRHHLRQHFWTGGLETVGPGCYDAVAIARAAGFRMLVMSRILNCSEPAKKSGQNIPKKSLPDNNS